MFEDITGALRTAMPELRGRLAANASLADVTWFRVGGPAQVLFMPADEADLAYFRKMLPKDVPVHVIGLGSNLLVRDGGVAGVVIRLGRGFNEIKVEDGSRLRAGTADESWNAGVLHENAERHRLRHVRRDHVTDLNGLVAHASTPSLTEGEGGWGGTVRRLDPCLSCRTSGPGCHPDFSRHDAINERAGAESDGHF